VQAHLFITHLLPSKIGVFRLRRSKEESTSCEEMALRNGLRWQAGEGRGKKGRGPGLPPPPPPVGFIGSSPVDYGDAGELKK